MEKKAEKEKVFHSIMAIQVRFNDVDIMGHVSNTVYQNYYDTGKLDYFDKVLPDMDHVNLGVVGASVKIDYLKPIFMRTRILVKTRVAVLGHKSFTMEHQLVDESTGEVLSTCCVVLVCFSTALQESLPIPEHWRQNILAYDVDVLVK